MKFQNRFFILIVACLLHGTLFSQFSIQYTGPTVFHLDDNCSYVLDLGGAVPVVTPLTPGASIVVDTLDTGLTGFDFGDVFIGEQELDLIFRIEDDMGNDTLFELGIEILDTIPPEFISDFDTLFIYCSDEMPDLSTYIVDDNCDVMGGISLNFFPLQNLPAVNCTSSPIEVNNLIEATDFYGNSDTLFQTVFLLPDTIAPAIEAPADTVISCSDLLQAVLDVGLQNVLDNCEFITERDSSVVYEFGTCSESYIINRYWTVRDSCGNIMMDTQRIEVLDDIAPTFTLMPDTVMNCEADYSVAALGYPLSISDNCSGVLDTSYVDAVEVLSCPNEVSIKRVWTIRDSCLNTIVDTQRIMLIDTLAPTFVPPVLDSVYIECSALDLLDDVAGPTDILDNCSTPAMNIRDTIINLTCPNSYQINRWFVIEDECGNLDSSLVRIFIEDTENPVFSDVGSDFDLECVANMNIDSLFGDWVASFAGIIATDNCSEEDSLSWAVYNAGTSDVATLDLLDCQFVPGFIVQQDLDFVVEDECGNSSTITKTFSIRDQILPSILSCGQDTVIEADLGLCSANFEFATAVVQDDCGSRDTLISLQEMQAIISDGTPTPLVQAVNFSIPVLNFSNSVSGPVSLEIELNNVDAEGLEEYFNIIGENGLNLGQTNLSTVQCGQSLTTVSIAAVDFNDWIADGVVNLQLVPNSPANPIDGINPVCGASTVNLSIEYSAVLNDDLSVFYSLDNAPYSLVSSGGILNEDLEVGLHTISYKVIDCGTNERVCSFNVEVIDTEAPQLICAPSQQVFLDPDSCTIKTVLDLPLGISDNCSPGLLTELNNPQQIISFDFNSNIGDFVAETVLIEFSGIDDNLSGDLQLDLIFTADMGQAGEYFEIYSSGGDLLGTTEIGNPGANVFDCDSEGTVSITIDFVTASTLIDGGNLSLELIPNNPFFPGIDDGGINPCADTSLVNGVVWDSVSVVQASLSFPSWDISYFIDGATQVGQTVINNININPEEILNAGESILYYVAGDAYGNLDSCSISLSVLDTIDPVMLCKSFVSVPFNSLDLDPASIIPSLFDDGSYDNCALNSLAISPSEISCVDAASGSVTVELLGTDSSGNEASCQSTLVIQESILSPQYAAICEGDTIINAVDLCFGDSLHLFSNVESQFPDLLSYTWKKDNNTIAFGQNTAVPLSPNTDYSGNYTLEVLGPNGCEKTAEFVISAFILPDPIVELSVGDTICEGTGLMLSAPSYNGLDDVEYHWYSGNTIGSGTLITTGSVPMLNLDASDLSVGNNCFYLETKKDCCSALSSSVICVEVLGQPQALPVQDSLSICQFGDLELSALGQSNPGLIYEWTGPGIPVNTIGQTVVIEDYSPNETGLFIVNLSVYHEDFPSCVSDPAEVKVFVLEKPETPVLTLDFDKVCIGATVTFSLSGDFTGVTSYHFIGDNELVSADPIFSLNDVDFNDQGTYTSVVKGNGCVSDPSEPVFLEVLNDPIAEILSETEICSSEEEYLLAASNQMGVSYTWELPSGDIIDGNPLTLNNPEEGLYSLEVDGGFPGCISTDMLSLTINENPEILSITDNVPICPPDNNFTLILDYQTNSNADLEEQWSFNNAFISNSSTLEIPNANPDDNGLYTLVIKDSQTNCLSDPLSVSINLAEELPIPLTPYTQDDDYQFCVGENVSFQTETFVNDSLYIWALDNGTMFDTSSSTISISDLSSFGVTQIRVRVLDENNCLSGWSAWRTFEILELPEISISFDNPVCEMEPIELSVVDCINLPGEVHWTLPDNSAVEGECLITDTQDLAGTYSYTYFYQLEECKTEESTVSVVVNPRPETPEYTVSDLEVCLDRKDEIVIELTNQGGGVDYVCLIDGAPINAFDGNAGPNTWTVMDLADYNSDQIVVGVVGSLMGCLSVDTNFTEVNFYNIPDETSFILESEQKLCEGEIPILEAQEPGNGITGLWTSLDPSVSIINPSSYITAVDGLDLGTYYSFEWTLSYGACTDFSSDESSIYIAYQEEAYAGPDKDICPVDFINLEATPTLNFPALGSWEQSAFQENNDVVISIPSSPSSQVELNPGLISEYTFIWKLPDYGCGESMDEVTIRLLNETPISGGDFSACGDGSVFMNGIEPINYTGVWSSPNENITFADSSVHNTLAENLEEGINIFYFDFLGGICGDEFREEVQIDYRFDPIANDDLFIIDNAGSFVFLDVIANDDIIGQVDISEMTILTEPFFGTASVTEQNQIRFASDPNYVGQVQLVYQIESAFCNSVSQATVTIEIGENPDCNLIPNIISPNDDGFNDQFVIPCIPQFPENKVEIFNVWGDKVFEVQGYQNDWGGDNLPSGTYYYVIRFSPSSEEFVGFLHIQR